MKTLLIIVSIILGGLLGAVIAFFGTFYGCVLLDYLDKESGGGYVAVGWIFIFGTVPFGFLVGAGLGGLICSKKMNQKPPEVQQVETEPSQAGE